ncbi:MAG: hypothetical protein JXP73_19295 [Deltaproteobacteria bacterium]|nr:hypothetical protein [Deltaproteobacteria bacterium]
MRIPYVIDNQEHVLAAVLSGLLDEHRGFSLDIATAYFTVGGYGLLADGLGELGSMRMLLGAEPRAGEDLGVRPDPAQMRRILPLLVETRDSPSVFTGMCTKRFRHASSVT